MAATMRRLKIVRLILLASLLTGFGCSSQPPRPTVGATPLITPVIRHNAAQGCEGEHDTAYLPGVSIDAFPSLPPKAQPDHIVLTLNDGRTIWLKPHYDSSDCTNYMDCRRATFVLNPTWSRCDPRGISYEVATVDGKSVLDSSTLEVTDSARKATVYVGFACGRGYAGPNLAPISNRTVHGSCPSQPSASTPGTNAAAEIALGAVYFRYGAAYARSVDCVTDELNGTDLGATCY